MSGAGRESGERAAPREWRWASITKGGSGWRKLGSGFGEHALQKISGEEGQLIFTGMVF